MYEPPFEHHVPRIVIDGRSIVCNSNEVRRLLVDALRIAEDPAQSQNFSIGRLMLVKDACELHCLGRHQRLVKMAIDRLNAEVAS